MLKTLLHPSSQRKATAIGLALTAVGIAAGAPARAATVYSTGFEAPTYSAGQLAGQGGWFNAPNTVVQTSTVKSGRQAVTADAGPLGQHVTYQALNYNSVGNPDQLVTMSTDFLVTPASGAVVWEALAAIGNGGFITQLLVTGNGQVCGFNPCDGPILTAGKWYNLSMQLNYATGTVTDLVDGVAFSSGPFSNIPAHSTTLSAIGIGVNDNFIDGTTHTASWDNILVTSAAVPEPATWAVMITGFGMVGLAQRRRRAAFA